MSATSITLRHLQSAAHLYSQIAPDVSAHVYGKFLDLAEDRGVTLPDTLSRAACPACRTIWVPGQNVDVTLRRRTLAGASRPVREALSTGRRNRRAKVMRYSCRTCFNTTEFMIPNGTAPEPTAATPTSTAPAPAESGKKRQKMRKQNTLQAMVANSKAKAKKETGGSLSLMDLMKSA
ncbi:uncharacterized protein V1510DRAFT_417893, partial [Dipodascopsis tothii]|uniref:uncharacterized protein n=1 Tax=Dipodascopsis tothii TaxID=44089 RepID=UPI0034CFD83A